MIQPIQQTRTGKACCAVAVLAALLLSACGGGSGSASSSTPSASSAALYSVPAGTLDRVDFGTAASEKAHVFNGGDADTATAGVGAFSQTFRQPRFVLYPTLPTENRQKLTFTVTVDPAKQNYLTVKLWGSDTQPGVLHMLDDGNTQQLDNNLSNGPGNPAFIGRFHYATGIIPMTMTKGKTSLALTLYSTGYFYDVGASFVGKQTRGVYSAFTHLNPYFVVPAGELTGTAPVQVGVAPPKVTTRATVYGWMKFARATMFNLDGAPDGFWNPGGTLVHEASVIPAGTPGAPPEVIGMKLGDGPVTAAQIAAINALPEGPADGWRNAVARNGLGSQVRAINTLIAIYLSPPLVDTSGATVVGYDRYLDPALLQRLVGVYDGLARMQTGSGGALGVWDTGCLDPSIPYRWAGVTSSPRAGGPWVNDKGRHDTGCITFEGGDGVNVARSMLRLLVDNPAAAVAFKGHLSQTIDVDFNGKFITRAAMYERMLAASVSSMGFGVKALTSTNLFDKAGGTAFQETIFLQNTYASQLALRRLLALFPSTDEDKQPMEPATMRSIVRQIVGLDNMVFMVPGDVGWRAITKAGIAEDYGTLSSGYDGRYGGGVPVTVGAMATLSKYDGAMSANDRIELATMARNTIAAFDNFLYPQHQIQTESNGNIVDTYALGQEDVISYRVPYGPNANGWNLNLQADAVDPNNIIKSPLAMRSFMIAASLGTAGNAGPMANFLEQQTAWLSIADRDPAMVPQLPGEPGASDFVWADVESGALAMNFEGERLFMNVNYNRPRGNVSQVARIHHITQLIDREATIRMPSDDATVQDDSNLTGPVDGAWVVRYGKHLIVLNRSSKPFTVKLPKGSGNASAVRAAALVPMGSTAAVAAGAYEVFVFP